ncbi:site-specific integrase [Cellulomonas timonensis]|uniref:tyrosine-type recombinase/integrase n=1 Tax=Cellulomonas timonensis TaxID=1689271 RepID=UPI00082BB4FD|nr:tyrosine-type recombinase/integrase [Cellulomonas timonensis]
MDQHTTSFDVVRSLSLSPAPPVAAAEWTCQTVAATFLRRGELVPPAEWSMMPGATLREIEVAGELVAASRAQATRKAYGRHVMQWLGWAREHEVCPLPATPGDLQLFLVERAIDLDQSEAEGGTGRVRVHGRLVMGSVTQMMAAISRLHGLAGLPSPAKDPRVMEFMSGMRRTLVQAPRGAKAALTWDLLTEVLDAQREAPMTDSQLRARVAQELCAATGASAGQLARLLCSDLTFKTDVVVVVLAPARRGWPRTRHEVDLHGPAGTLLCRWLRTMKGWPGTAVLRDREGNALTRQGLHKILVVRRAPLEGDLAADRVVTLADVRDRALLLSGWMSALRRSNLAALTWDELMRTSSGWVLYVARSKTDQEGRGRTVAVPSAPPGSAIADPAGAIDDWLSVVTMTMGSDPRRLLGVPVFVRIDRHGHMRLVDGRPVGLSGGAISEIVKRRVRAAGLEDRTHPTRAGLWSHPGRGFSAHSLRAGFVTEGFKRKLTANEISAVTGHTSMRTLADYDRPESPGLIAATAMLGALSDAQPGTPSSPAAARATRRRGPDWTTPVGVAADGSVAGAPR